MKISSKIAAYQFEFVKFKNFYKINSELKLKKAKNGLEGLEVKVTFATAKLFAKFIKGELPEWLMEQFAKLSTSNCRMSSNLILSATIFRGVA